MPDHMDDIETAWEQIDRLKAELQEARMDAGGERVKHLEEIGTLRAEVERLRNAIASHHAQKADDRCIEDDDRLYAAAGLPPCDRRVGDKTAMLVNCARFIQRRCEAGGWPSYAELEAEVERLRTERDAAIAALHWSWQFCSDEIPDPAASLKLAALIRSWRAPDLAVTRTRIVEAVLATDRESHPTPNGGA